MESTAPDHRPALLFLGVGGGLSIKRGACLGCEWEGPDRSRETEAVEDAHDHVWPGWNCPPVRWSLPGRRGGPSFLPGAGRSPRKRRHKLRP
ncbi:DUF6349 family protein [Microbispora sp. ATCC PTA-5024]|uniref:DUF6349 family protein n=1 Tax=Microbispora sp. ATCC PTA-5024 TaxID=316330 RepID=UPI003FA5B25A